MLLARAAKFGLIASVGVTFVSLATGWLIWNEYTTRISGQDPPWFIMLLVGVVGVIVLMIFLFVVVGEYLERELEARGLAETEQ